MQLESQAAHRPRKRVNSNLYPRGEAGARTRLARIPIVHLHGMLGGYPPLNRGKGVDFGADVNATTITRASRRIKIIEDCEDNDGLMEYDDAFQEAYELLQAAEQVLMLGFGFDPKNVQRLALNEVLRARTAVHATAYKVAAGVVSRARAVSGLGDRLYLHNVTCTELLHREGEMFSFH